jgi:acetyl esterase
MKFSNTMITAGLAGLLILSAQTTLAAKKEKKAAPAPETLPGARAEIYKTIGDVKLPIHIFEPKGSASGTARPAIVFFFGGGWSNGSPAQFEKQCAYLASRGMVAMTAEYRVLSRHGVKAVSCFSDAKSAIRWVRQNAKRLGIDPKRVAAGGGSAGGHLAGALGTIREFDEPGEDLAISAVPDALALFNPALVLAAVKGHDTSDPEKLSAMEERMGVPPEQLSPYHHIRAGLPPTIIFHGRADTTVPYDTSRWFAEKAQELGNHVELVGYDDQKHGFFNYGKSDNRFFADTLKKLDAFLVSLGYLTGPDRVDAFMAEDAP